MDIVNQFIATSLAIKVFKRDQKSFMDFKFFELYLDMTDAVIDKLQEDLNTLRKELITKHHIDVRQLDGTKYLVKGRNANEVREFTSDQLKQMTTEVMDRYLTGDKAAPFERQSGRWKIKLPHNK